jgi:hypothetical protein
MTELAVKQEVFLGFSAFPVDLGVFAHDVWEYNHGDLQARGRTGQPQRLSADACGA